jgi:class 3 adenylate cyclase/tetratricopeptide (TPR) repeat protein
VAICRTCGTENVETARFCQSCGGALGEDDGGAPHEVRKTVTILFADVAGSTALGERLDPEALRGVMSRYYHEMRTVLESHGGTVEKFIGDAVMAVFGAPVAHEDDALRAVRAADEMRNRLRELNGELEPRFGVALEMRIGVNTGEVVAGDRTAGQALVSGDAVNLAKRLEEAAPDGSILIGKSTYPLVKDAVQAGPLESFKVKGKAAPVSPMRLDAVDPHAAGVARRLDRPFVGRFEELSALRLAFTRVEAEQSCRMFTVLGPAGIGKSRLVGEFIENVPATALTGRCLPYGEGISLWPFREIIRGLGGAEGLAQALASAEDAELVVERLLSAVGASPGTASADETPWALRRLLETLADRRPVVVVLEDIHWAAPVLLDVIEYLLGWVRRPLFLVCVARPDLLQLRPGWVNPRPNADTLVLEALAAQEAESLLSELRTTPEARARIAEAAEGNPLFLEQMAAMLSEQGDDAAGDPVPPSIQALLAARLDQLSHLERAVVERAAVVGREFPRAAVTALSPAELEPSLVAALMSLVRKELLTPDGSAGQEDVFRFGHILIRDAAYDAIPKAVRAQLHEQLARWLEERETAPEEIVGYHLEQANRLLTELGADDETRRRLSAEAATKLASAGRRALGRGDAPAATSLFQRAETLAASAPELRGAILVDLGAALREAGSLDASGSTLADAVETATQAGDRRAAARARLERAFTQMHSWQGLEGIPDVADEVLPVLTELGDDEGLVRAWSLSGWAEYVHCRISAAESKLERALASLEQATDRRQERGIFTWLAKANVDGPRRADEAIARLGELRARLGNDPTLDALTATNRAQLEAMRGRFEEARQLYRSAHASFEELGQFLPLAGARLDSGLVEVLAGDPKAAERELASGYQLLESIGGTSVLSSVAALLGGAVLAQGRADEAERYASLSAEISSDGDVFSQVEWRILQSSVCTATGRPEEGWELAQEALQLLVESDALSLKAGAFAALGAASDAVGRSGDAAAAWADADRLAQRKGNVALAARLQTQRLTQSGALSPSRAETSGSARGARNGGT